MTDDEGVVRRERMAGIYRLSAYFLAVLTTEIPVVIIVDLMFITVSYWMANLMPTAGNFTGHSLSVLLFTFACQVLQIDHVLHELSPKMVAVKNVVWGRGSGGSMLGPRGTAPPPKKK